MNKLHGRGARLDDADRATLNLRKAASALADKATKRIEAIDNPGRCANRDWLALSTQLVERDLLLLRREALYAAADDRRLTQEGLRRAVEARD